MFRPPALANKSIIRVITKTRNNKYNLLNIFPIQSCCLSLPVVIYDKTTEQKKTKNATSTRKLGDEKIITPKAVEILEEMRERKMGVPLHIFPAP